jgi:hypothetical protein
MPSRAHALQLPAGIPLIRAAELRAAPAVGTWRFTDLVGILAELSEEAPSGALSFAAEIMAGAQAAGEHAAWVASQDSLPFPPDLAARGIDLGALTIVRAGPPPGAFTAAEWLVRSGAVGLVIVDAVGLGPVSDAVLGRVLKVAERELVAVLFLTRKPAGAPSLGSRISLHGFAARCGTAPAVVTVATVKDKRTAPGARLARQYNGPPGVH